MRFALLGPLEITDDDGAAVELRGPKMRVLAALLLCKANQPVPAEVLADGLWGQSPTRRAAGSVRVHVFHLRQALGDTRVEPRAEGLPAAGRARRARHRPLPSARGRGALGVGGGPAGLGLGAVRSALHLWRGPALAGFDDVVALGNDRYSLDELRLQTMKQRFGADLASGRHAEIGAELRVLVSRHPFRETFRAQLMHALVAGGRSAEALEVFDDGRRCAAARAGARGCRGGAEAASGGRRRIHRPGPAPAPPRRAAAERRRHHGGDAGRRGERHRRHGQTTLTVHWAHLVKDRFPDGRLYVNLHGFDPSRAPVEPSTALGVLLGALGVPARRLPDSVEERENLYRTLLASRAVLVLLDNAHDAAQVRPLLPGSGGCLALVTSRNLLAGLVTGGAHPVVLDLLDAHEARELLRARLGTARTARIAGRRRRHRRAVRGPALGMERRGRSRRGAARVAAVGTRR